MLKVKKLMAGATASLLATLVAAWFLVGDLGSLVILYLTIVFTVIVQV